MKMHLIQLGLCLGKQIIPTVAGNFGELLNKTELSDKVLRASCIYKLVTLFSTRLFVWSLPWVLNACKMTLSNP